MKVLQTNTVYLIGIGGIGMSALARYFKQQGKEVSGYDRTETALTKQMEEEGINIHYVDDPAYIPCDAGLVIYTPAIPDSSREITYCREVDMTVMKRAEVLGLIAEGFKTIAIAGTHGKTSISSMVAHIMHHNAYAVTAMIGGIMKNYDSNMIRSFKSKYLIAEADEYDRSFLSLHPHIAVVTTLAADHLDIYGSLEKMKESFSRFVSQIEEGGKVILHESLKGELKTSVKPIIYGRGKDSEIKIETVEVKDHRYHFTLSAQNEHMRISMLVPGMHNIENATAAAAVCLQCGMNLDEIREGLESYRGVKRRFEYILDNPVECIFIDDYAHHPDEISACIATARELYPERKLTGIFQPHLYSRTRDFASGFAEVLDMLDELILLDIYPAREEPIEGVNAQMLFNLVSISDKTICSKEELPSTIHRKMPELLLTMGAGDIDQLIAPIKKKLEKQ